jgi:hypothetical protein
VAKVEFCAKNERQNEVKRSRFSEEQTIAMLKEAEAVIAPQALVKR